jgi:homoserine dehydrogenase
VSARRLPAGKHVVTANKALLAKHGVELARLAEEKGRLPQLRGGGRRRHPGHQDDARVACRQRCQPRLRHLERHLQLHPDPDGSRRDRFEKCLADAQRLGYAEADPTFDIEGNDTAHKLAILTSLAFGTQIAADKIYLEGISFHFHVADIQAATNSVTGSSCSASRSAPTPASNSACTRPWCRSARRSPDRRRN